MKPAPSPFWTAHSFTAVPAECCYSTMVSDDGSDMVMEMILHQRAHVQFVQNRRRPAMRSPVLIPALSHIL